MMEGAAQSGGMDDGPQRRREVEGGGAEEEGGGRRRSRGGGRKEEDAKRGVMVLGDLQLVYFGFSEPKAVSLKFRHEMLHFLTPRRQRGYTVHCTGFKHSILESCSYKTVTSHRKGTLMT
jgi:hypothetical protein